jgi:hypothetical protein
MTINKIGRPIGAKKKNQILTFEQEIQSWDKKEKQVDLKDLCDKLQEALAKSYVEADQFERQIGQLRSEIAARDVIINYLESRRT